MGTNMQHLYRRYTPREWLTVILLIVLSGYVVHIERRAAIIVHAQNVTMENATLQLELIRLNRRYSELLVSLVAEEHRRGPRIIIPTSAWRKWDGEIAVDQTDKGEER